MCDIDEPFKKAGNDSCARALQWFSPPAGACKASAMDRAKSLSFWATLGGDVAIKPVADLTSELSLGEGRTNENFIATASDGVRYFVRIGGDLPAYGVTRAKEQAASRAAAAAGVGPRVHHSEKDAMIVDFCPGKTLTDAEFRAACSASPAAADAALLVRVSTTLRKLHAIEVPEEMTAVASAGWAPADVRKWIALAEQGGYTRLPMIARARELLEELEAAAGPPSTPPAFCHYDLLPDNLVVGRGGDEGVWVIDFEYAAAGQPLMDLAVMAMGCDLSAAEEGNLLAAYHAASAPAPLAPPDGLARLFACLKVLACLRETMWGVVAEVSGTSALAPEEAIAYADKNYARLTAAHAAFFGGQ